MNDPTLPAPPATHEPPQPAPVPSGAPTPAILTRSSADQHEIEAARAGHVASCCGRPDTRAWG